MLAATEYVVDAIRSMGCDASGQSRFGQMHRILSNGQVAPDNTEFNLALEALRDVQILEFVLDQLTPILPSETLAAKIRQTVKDPCCQKWICVTALAATRSANFLLLQFVRRQA